MKSVASATCLFFIFFPPAFSACSARMGVGRITKQDESSSGRLVTTHWPRRQKIRQIEKDKRWSMSHQENHETDQRRCPRSLRLLGLAPESKGGARDKWRLEHKVRW